MSVDFFPGVVEGIIDFTNGGGNGGNVKTGHVYVDNVTVAANSGPNVTITTVLTTTSLRVVASRREWSRDISATISPGYVTEIDKDNGSITITKKAAIVEHDIPVYNSPTKEEEGQIVPDPYVVPTENVTLIPDNTYVHGDLVIEGIPYVDGNTPTISGPTVTFAAGRYQASHSGTVPAGTAKTSATTITIPTENVTVAVNSANGTITVTGSTKKSLTPVITAGYISQGTAATVSASIAQKTQTQQAATFGISTPEINFTNANNNLVVTVNSSGVINIAHGTNNRTSTVTASALTYGFTPANNSLLTGTVTANVSYTASVMSTQGGGTYTQQSTVTTIVPAQTFVTGDIKLAASGAAPTTFNVSDIATSSTPVLSLIGSSGNYGGQGYSLSGAIPVTKTTKRSANSVTITGSQVTVTAGYYSGAVTKNVSAGSFAIADDSHDNEAIEVSLNSSNGIITAAVSSYNITVEGVGTAGYISAGTTSGTLTINAINTTFALTTLTGRTISPVWSAGVASASSTRWTAAAKNRYTTGTVYIGRDANLIPENIAKDVTIYGVVGEHEGGVSPIGNAVESTTIATSTSTLRPTELIFTLNSSASIQSIEDIGIIMIDVKERVDGVSTILQPYVSTVIGYQTVTANTTDNTSSDYWGDIYVQGLAADGVTTGRVKALKIPASAISVTSQQFVISLASAATSGAIPTNYRFMESAKYRLTLFTHGAINGYTSTDFDQDTGGNS